MFEISFLNKLRIRCGQHPECGVTHICIDIRCEGNALLCQQCTQNSKTSDKHSGHALKVLPILEAVDELTRQIENGVEPTRNIYHRLISYKPNEGLLKWQSEKEHHFNSVKRNLEGLKFQIEEETQRILRDFAEQLQKAKAELYLDLEQYYVSYCERFERFAQMTDPIVAMYDRFQLYTNRNALLFKFGTEDEPYKLRNWLTQLKKSIHFTLGSLRSPEQYSQQVLRAEQGANALIDCTPSIQTLQYERELPLILGDSVHRILKSLVTLSWGKSNGVPRSNSLDALNQAKKSS